MSNDDDFADGEVGDEDNQGTHLKVVNASTPHK